MGPGVLAIQERAERLLTRFRLMARSDDAVERRAKITTILAVVFAVAAAVSAVVLVQALEHRRAGAAIPWSGPVAAVVTVAAVYLGFRARAWWRLDLDDRKLATAIRLLAILRADIPRDEKIAVAVDFRGALQGGQEVARTRDGARRVTKYRHAWLRVRTRLADGNTLALAVTDRIKRKQKRRVTLTCVSVVMLTMRLDKRYRAFAAEAVLQLRARPPVVHGPRGAVLRLVRAEVIQGGRVLRLVLRSQPVAEFHDMPAGDALLATLRWAYGGIADARRAIQPEAARGPR